MGRPSTTNKTLNRWLSGMLVAAVVGGGLAWSISTTRPDEWLSCFDDVQSASALGHDASEAMTAVRAAKQRTHQRRLANERALKQLSADARWGVPDQRKWLEMAVEQTRAEISSLERDEEEVGETEGCLEDVLEPQ